MQLIENINNSGLYAQYAASAKTLSATVQSKNETVISVVEDGDNYEELKVTPTSITIAPYGQNDDDNKIVIADADVKVNNNNKWISLTGVNNALTSVSGTFMQKSKLEYNSNNQISGYDGSAFANMFNDETILWQGVEGQTSFTLSEALTNFEEVIVYVKNTRAYVQFSANAINGVCTVFIIGDAYPVQTFGFYLTSSDGLTFTYNKRCITWCNGPSIGGSNIASQAWITKIVGVNRKSS